MLVEQALGNGELRRHVDLAQRFPWASGPYDFFALLAFFGIFFGCLFNLIPMTIAGGTRRQPDVPMRTDGGIMLDVLRWLVSARNGRP